MTADEGTRRLEPVTLTGVHVRLEPLALAHLDGLMRAGADDAIWQWLPWRPQTRDEYELWFEAAWQPGDRGEQVPFATIDQASGDVVGSTRLMAYSPRDRRIEIGGTWLAPRAQRTPVNTEAKLLQLTHCFESMGLLRVELKTDARNERSRAAILRIGAQFEGIHRKDMLTRGGFQRDSAYFAIIDDDWTAVKARLEGMLRRAG